MRKITIVSIVAMLALVLSLSFAFAADEEIAVYLDGEQVNLTTDAVLESGRTLVPFRSIFEAMGLEVGWDDETWTVTGTDENTEIVLTIDSATATVNGEEKTLDVAPVLKDGSTLIPLRFVAEAAGCNVEWVSDDWEVKIWNVDETAPALIEQINAANAETESIAMTMTSKISAVVVEAGETTTMDMDMAGDIKVVIDGDKVEMYMLMKMGVVENGEKEEMEVVYYFKDNAMYMIMDGAKVKLEMDVETASTQVNTGIDTSDIAFDETTIKGSKVEALADGGYKLTFIMKADALNDLLDTSFAQSLTMLEEMDLGLENMEITMDYSDVTIEFIVDKELKLVSQGIAANCDVAIGEDSMTMDMIINMEMVTDGEAITIEYPTDLDSYVDFVEYMLELAAAAADAA